MVFVDFEFDMDPIGVKIGWKRFREAICFILAEYAAMASYGEPFHARNHGPQNAQTPHKQSVCK